LDCHREAPPCWCRAVSRTGMEPSSLLGSLFDRPAGREDDGRVVALASDAAGSL